MAPHTHLQRRAQITATGWILIICLVSIAVCGIFCIGVLFFMWKKKRERQQRTRDLAEERRPFVDQGYQASHNQHGPVEIMSTGGPIELQGGVVENKPQHFHGYAVPATVGWDGKPVEMPAQLPTR
ncbi:hypothetical protein EK21DRAFT_77232 [Setomelanomma holmii]|uniref:Uncharacterized protein n=1 Tax=Setomelanomma holmii TaxID=210430 RepID=A0A9P4GZP0_9PLEO|nr:hypothetical protein EK21DRAFT_77232 [Setomelanomma holmii]